MMHVRLKHWELSSEGRVADVRVVADAAAWLNRFRRDDVEMSAGADAASASRGEVEAPARQVASA